MQAGAPQSQPSVPPQSTHTGPDPAPSGDGLNAVLQIPINVEIVLGSAQMTVSELAALAKGSIMASSRARQREIMLRIMEKWFVEFPLAPDRTWQRAGGGRSYLQQRC